MWEERREVAGEERESERRVGGTNECGRSGKDTSAKVLKKKNGERERERARAFGGAKRVSERRGEEKERCVLWCAPDESERDKEINCQEEPVNPERQRREHVCI